MINFGGSPILGAFLGRTAGFGGRGRRLALLLGFVRIATIDLSKADFEQLQLGLAQAGEVAPDFIADSFINQADRLLAFLSDVIVLMLQAEETILEAGLVRNATLRQRVLLQDRVEQRDPTHDVLDRVLLLFIHLTAGEVLDNLVGPKRLVVCHQTKHLLSLVVEALTGIAELLEEQHVELTGMRTDFDLSSSGLKNVLKKLQALHYDLHDLISQGKVGHLNSSHKGLVGGLALDLSVDVIVAFFSACPRLHEDFLDWLFAEDRKKRLSTLHLLSSQLFLLFFFVFVLSIGLSFITRGSLPSQGRDDLVVVVLRCFQRGRSLLLLVVGVFMVLRPEVGAGSFLLVGLRRAGHGVEEGPEFFPFFPARNSGCFVATRGVHRIYAALETAL